MRRIGLCAAVVLASGAVLGATQSDWDSLRRLTPEDRIRVVTAADHMEGRFEAWTAEAITVGAARIPREQVIRVERRKPGAWSRSKKAAFGALIGGGSGALLGAATTSSCSGSMPLCINRAEGAAVIGAIGLLGGALVGAALPAHPTEVIYSKRP